METSPALLNFESHLDVLGKPEQIVLWTQVLQASSSPCLICMLLVVIISFTLPKDFNLQLAISALG